FPLVIGLVCPFAPGIKTFLGRWGSTRPVVLGFRWMQVAPTIISAGISLQIPIILLHLLGGLIGYFLPRAMGFSEVSSRTMAIETSMKSSAFGFLLAKLHFGTFEARVPAAISVVWMAITGSMMAIIWRYIPVEAPKFDRGVKDRFEKVGTRLVCW
ncbi:unnamed protein product, partial [Hapterophycus canaliculatus]